MTIPGPILVLGIPAIVSVGLQLLRRWTTLSAWLAALSAGIIGVMVSVLPLTKSLTLEPIGITQTLIRVLTRQPGLASRPLELALGRPLIILGRILIIEPVDRLPLLFLFFTSAGIFILAWRLLPHSNFFPVGLAMATLLAGALLVQQVVYAALLVEMAAILAVFPLHEPQANHQSSRENSEEGELQLPDGQSHSRKSRTVGGLRYMAYTTLALPGLMATHLLLELFAIFPNDLGLLNTARILLTLSFAILLGAVPFQSWLSTVAIDGSPPVVTFLFTVNIGTVWFMLLAYLQSYTWLSEQAVFGSLFNAVGLLMMVMGGMLAASQKQLGRFIGYATLVDNGAMMVALGTQQTAGIALAVMTLLARPFSLGLMTLGLQGLRASQGWRAVDGGDNTDLLRGAAWRAPWRAIAFMTGGVALAGFPLSLGFTARWGLYRLVSTRSLFQALLALSSSATVMMGLVSAVRNLLTPVKETDGYPLDHDLSGEKSHSTITEDRVVVVLILLLISATLILGLFPQVPSKVALQMAEGFTFFEP